MNKVIHKWPLGLGHTEVLVGKSAKVLTAQIQPEQGPQVWIEVTPGAVHTHRLSFRVVGTGQLFRGFLDSEWNYLSTFQMIEMHLVFHVYYRWETL